MASLRIATFNLENLDDKPNKKPTLDDRIEVMRPQLDRLRADVLCFQEVNGQEFGNTRRLQALEDLLKGTAYGNYELVTTRTTEGKPYDERNLVIASRYPILEHHQYKHVHAPAPAYKKVTADPPDDEAKNVTWERPILHARVDLAGKDLHVINLHLKSKRPSNVEGQTLNWYTWKTASAWAEGSFISAMKRMGQALETRILVDKLFDAEEDARVVVCGDFNAEMDDVPLEAIRGSIEGHNNPELVRRSLVPCEFTVPESARFTLYHRGRRNMLDHVLASQSMLSHYRGTEIHNEVLHDESVAFATDTTFPASDHAPVVAEFELP